jgi:predicted lipoprotein with Yx(FWY)xxD motif
VKVLGVSFVLVSPALLAAGCGASAHPTSTPAQASSSSRPAAQANRSTGPAPAVRAAPAVRVARTPYGRALVDRRGFALYLFTRDHSPASTCYGGCATTWPPYIVKGQPSAAGQGARGALLGSTRRRDGRLQVTYAGHPLYYYIGDRHPRQVLCQAATEFGGMWYVVAPHGHAIR